MPLKFLNGFFTVLVCLKKEKREEKQKKEKVIGVDLILALIMLFARFYETTLSHCLSF